MLRVRWLLACLGLSVVPAGFPLSCPVRRCAAEETRAPRGEFVFRHENVLGTSLLIRLKSGSPQAADQAERVVLEEIDRLSRIFSRYDEASELSRWSRGEIAAGKVTPELFGVFERAQAWNAKTGGAFDIRAQVHSNLWNAAAKSGRLPTRDESNEALRLARKPAWSIDADLKRLNRTSSAPISLDAIATGTIIDAAIDRVQREVPKVQGLLIDIGGDIRVAGDMEALIGVAPPRGDSESAVPIARLRLRNKAVTTSGDTYRGFDIGGVRYSHIIDPTTGKPAENAVSATVIAPTAEIADALATSFCVMAPENSLRLAASLPDVECLIVTNDGRLFASPGWPGIAVPENALASAIQASLAVLLRPAAILPIDGKSLPLPLKVEFEIDQPEASRRYRKPYVAVWIEDQDGLTVRTLILWIQKEGVRWHPDLRRWWRDDQARKLIEDTDLIATFSRATRPPGKYDIVWDGKDDAGAPVKPGTYTVLIETAREHGTYQLIRQEVTLGDKPFTKSLAGNVEIKSARLVYGNSTGR